LNTPEHLGKEVGLSNRTDDELHHD